MSANGSANRRTSIRTLVSLLLMCLSLAMMSVQSFSPNLQQRQKSTLSTRSMSAVTIERDDVLVIPKEVKAESEAAIAEERRSGSESWEVRIYNDGLNTREHVARCLVQVTGLSELQAYSTMMLAHHQGMAAVGQWVYEIAEMYHDALRNKGIICDLVPVDEQQ